MNQAFLLLFQDFTTIVWLSVFAVLLTVVYEVLKKMQLFETTGNCVLAVCIALLSVLGLLRFTTASSSSPGTQSDAAHHVSVDFILLPYAALALAIILIMLWTPLYDRFRKHHRKERSKDATRRLD